MNRPLSYIWSVLGLVLLGIAVPTAAQPESATERLVTELGGYCNRATEVSYRSSVLVASDGTRVHVAGLVRKLIDDEMRERSSNVENFCYGSTIETLSAAVVVDGEDESYELLDEAERNAYLLLEPLSFSSDNRYLAMRTEYIVGGVSGSQSVAFFDLEAGEIVQTPSTCQREVSGSFDSVVYEGFSAPSTAVVRCSSFRPRMDESRVEWHEAIDLDTRENQVLLSQPNDLQSYGTIADGIETNVQEFPF